MVNLLKLRAKFNVNKRLSRIQSEKENLDPDLEKDDLKRTLNLVRKVNEPIYLESLHTSHIIPVHFITINYIRSELETLHKNWSIEIIINRNNACLIQNLIA